jgi:hypothetical protein
MKFHYSEKQRDNISNKYMNLIHFIYFIVKISSEQKMNETMANYASF